MTAADAPMIRFVIGGVQKGGTSALAHYLSGHPALALPRGKEAHVFDAPEFDDAWLAEQVDARYLSHFDAGEEDAIHGDATPIYIFHPASIQRIARYNPAMRWIVLLRDPVARAVSHYHMEKQRGDESWPLWAALTFENWRLRGHRNDWSAQSPLRHWTYRRRGRYAEQLRVLEQYFPREQILLVDSDRLRAQPGAVLARVCRFLDIAPFVRLPPPAQVFSGAYAPPGPLLRLWLGWLMRDELRQYRASIGAVAE